MAKDVPSTARVPPAAAAPAAAGGLPSPSSRNGVPAEICGYAIDRLLSPGGGVPTFLAIGPGGRGVVLKGLDPDCLLKTGSLHPSIRDRLARVRELATTGVANLHGVERDAAVAGLGHEAWLVWEYVPGRTFDGLGTEPGRSPRELAVMARELVLTVEALHLQGIVHGSIRGGNVIVGPTGAIRLTHVSPLLYTDPAEDAQCVVEMLWDVIARRKEQRTPLGRLVAEALEWDWADAPAGLKRLGTRLATLAEPRGAEGTGPGGRPAARRRPEPDAGPRKRSLVGAAVVALLGLAAAYVVWGVVGNPPVPLPKAMQETISARLRW